MKTHKAAARKVQTQVLLEFIRRGEKFQVPGSRFQCRAVAIRVVGHWNLELGTWNLPSSFPPPQPHQPAEQQNRAGDRTEQKPVHGLTLLGAHDELILDDVPAAD